MASDSTTTAAATAPAPSPLAALRYPGVRWYLLARTAGMIGLQTLLLAVQLQIYDLTGKPLNLGLVGLAQALPSLALGPVAGDTADRFPRKWLLMICYALFTACGAVLALIARSEHPATWTIFVVLGFVGVARVFAGPAAQSLLPNLVDAAHFPNTVAWSSVLWHLSLVGGPLLGGAVYDRGGARAAYAVAAAMQLTAMVAMPMVPARPGAAPAGDRSWRRLLVGFEFVWRRKMILGALSLDMFAVLLGGAVALFPVYARDILHVGAVGLGMLRGALPAGASLMAVLLAYRPIRRRSGVAMFAGVAVFGVMIMVFGESRVLWLSVAALFVAGCADMVSVFVRQNLVQLGTPDGMRGGVSAVNLAFIGVSNELGEFESGAVAGWLGTVGSVVGGGIGSIVIVGLWVVLFPSLRRVDRLDPAELSAGDDAPPYPAG